MNKKLVKAVSLVVALMLSVSLFAACAKKAENAAPTPTGTETVKNDAAGIPEEFVTLKVLYPGDESKRMTSFLEDEFKQKIKEELNLGMEINYSPWDQYWNKKDMMIAAGEQIEWYWDGGPNFNRIAAKKQCIPLDELLDKYGTNLKKVIPQENFQAFTAGGKIMAIPSQYGPTSEKFKSVFVRQDLLEKAGMSEIKSIADLEQFAQKAKEQNPAINVFADPLFLALGRELSDVPFTFAGTQYTIGIDETTGKAFSYYESDTFKKTCELTRKWAEKGYIPEEVSVKYNEYVNRMKSGNYLACLGAISRPMEDINDLRKNVPEARGKEYLLAPEKPNYKFLASTEVICISPTAKYPDRSVMFFDWMYKNQDNYLFCLYGVKDKDYTIENGRIKQINTDALFYEWMFRNLNYMLFTDSVDDSFIASFKEWDNNAKLSRTFGFQFDSTPVKAEESKLGSVYDEKVIPLATGYVDFDKYYPQMVEALKAAGIEKYIAEYQKQLDEYIAGK